MADGPKEYSTEVDYVLPNPTNTASEPDPLEPCTAAEEVELANEKSTAKSQGLPAPEPWCKSSVEDPETPAEDDEAADSDERAGADAAASGADAPAANTTAPADAAATAQKTKKAHVPHKAQAKAQNPPKSAKKANVAVKATDKKEFPKHAPKAIPAKETPKTPEVKKDDKPS